LYADFHALRHTFITSLGRAGVELRTAQELAGHSSPIQTARYSHRRLHDLAGAVEMLPRFLPDRPDQSDALRATGTDGKAAAKWFAKRVGPAGISRHREASAGIWKGMEEVRAACHKSLSDAPIGTVRHSAASPGISVGMGLEPTTCRSTVRTPR